VLTDDCELDYGEIGPWKGVDAVTAFMQQAHALAGHTMHRLSNQAIAVDGDKAPARTYLDGLLKPVDNKSRVNAIPFSTTRSSAPTTVAHRAPPVYPGAAEYGGEPLDDVRNQMDRGPLSPAHPTAGGRSPPPRSGRQRVVRWPGGR
jgi:hypothetical protein